MKLEVEGPLDGKFSSAVGTAGGTMVDELDILLRSARERRYRRGGAWLGRGVRVRDRPKIEDGEEGEEAGNALEKSTRALAAVNDEDAERAQRDITGPERTTAGWTASALSQGTPPPFALAFSPFSLSLFYSSRGSISRLARVVLLPVRGYSHPLSLGCALPRTLHPRTTMHLAPREKDKIFLHQVGSLAQKRLARGVKLNVGEATALIGETVLVFCESSCSRRQQHISQPVCSKSAFVMASTV